MSGFSIREYMREAREESESKRDEHVFAGEKRGKTASKPKQPTKLLEGTEGWVDWLPPESPKELDEMGEFKRLAGLTHGYGLPKPMTSGDRSRPQARPTDGILDPVSAPKSFDPPTRR